MQILNQRAHWQLNYMDDANQDVFILPCAIEFVSDLWKYCSVSELLNSAEVTAWKGSACCVGGESTSFISTLNAGLLMFLQADDWPLESVAVRGLLECAQSQSSAGGAVPATTAGCRAFVCNRNFNKWKKQRWEIHAKGDPVVNLTDRLRSLFPHINWIEGRSPWSSQRTLWGSLQSCSDLPAESSMCWMSWPALAHSFNRTG